MSKACRTQGGGFGGKSMRDRRPRNSWDVNIKIDLREMEWGGMELHSFGSVRDQRQALMNSNEVPQNIGKFVTTRASKSECPLKDFAACSSQYFLASDLHSGFQFFL
jgi:hypothetical protein